SASSPRFKTMRVLRRFAAFALLASASLAHPQTALLHAAEDGDTTRALAAIDEGGDVRAATADGTTALHYAIYRDDAKLVERLVPEGARLFPVKQFGSTARSAAR